MNMTIPCPDCGLVHPNDELSEDEFAERLEFILELIADVPPQDSLALMAMVAAEIIVDVTPETRHDAFKDLKRMLPIYIKKAIIRECDA